MTSVLLTIDGQPVYSYDGDDGSVPVPVPGPKGDKGDKGDKGEQGIQGIQGIQGVPGTGGGGSTANGFFRPANATELAQCIRDATESANPYIALIDSRTEVEIASTLQVKTKDAGGNQYGVRFNGAHLVGTMASGPIIQINGGPQIAPDMPWSNVRRFEFSDVSIHNDNGATACIKIVCPKAREIRGLFEKLNLQSSASHNLHLVGDLYESWFPNLNSENAAGSGVYIENGNGVISNLKFRDMNLSRNGRYGMETLSRHLHLDGGSFINNALGGIWADMGLFQAHALQFENSGLNGIKFNRIQFTATVYGCEASSNGKQAAAGGQPMRYLLSCPASENSNLYFPLHPFNRFGAYNETGGPVFTDWALRAP